MGTPKRGGFQLGHLIGILYRADREASRTVASWGPETQDDFFDKLGRAYAAALDRAMRYGAAREQARTGTNKEART